MASTFGLGHLLGLALETNETYHALGDAEQ